ncbi:XRE family transcriptional regulator [Saccharothrix obliqua]|uniref:XRE family transcriptional regulator n=1 Tax=Saccharothrix obliqua TaxID=2861747 RepID=UPI001C5F9D0F|nr:XRE family transcriptional regulator [Saccharothrix obliqua]MBW4720635.1 XRE family transcriptional regulator [Saccharothrix obliqua]
MVGSGGSFALAHRLRALREEHWPDVAITQADLAAAFSADKPASVPLLSSWESRTHPKAPPVGRLAAYATFFATRRSVEDRPFRLLPAEELTPDEARRRDELLAELTALRAAGQESPEADRGSRRDFWFFPDRNNITIVVAQLPKAMRDRMPYADPTQPDYVELYTYADLDALIELHGHIRALNPRSRVRYRIASALSPDDYTSHLVLLGGVDWNVVTRELLDRVDLPVSQVGRHDESEPGGFVVGRGDAARVFGPRLARDGDRDELQEDVAHFYRGPNPFNHKRTVTVCNGMYGRGTLGAVRALTDERFRDRNADYLRKTFPGLPAYSLLTRVSVVNGQVVTPDWNLPWYRLYEWPEDGG